MSSFSSCSLKKSETKKKAQATTKELYSLECIWKTFFFSSDLKSCKNLLLETLFTAHTAYASMLV